MRLKDGRRRVRIVDVGVGMILRWVNVKYKLEGNVTLISSNPPFKVLNLSVQNGGISFFIKKFIDFHLTIQSDSRSIGQKYIGLRRKIFDGDCY